MKSVVAAGLIFASMSMSAAGAVSYEDWWWNASQSGHGINIGQQGNVLFVSWFTYDENGAGMWLVMAAPLAGNTATGAWTRTTGPALGSTFDPDKVTRTEVGRGTLTFADPLNASLEWTVNGKSGTVALTRQTWGPIPVLIGDYDGRSIGLTNCGGPTIQFNEKIRSTLTTAANTITMVDTLSFATCTKTGTLSAAGSRLSVVGTFACSGIPLLSHGSWQGTVATPPTVTTVPAAIIVDEVLTAAGNNGCADRHTNVLAPIY